MDDYYNLNRFLTAQKIDYQKALSEILNGKKVSHWMWYIFPQFNGIGRSITSKNYAIKSKNEALSYLKHPILGNRLIEITEVFLLIENKTASEILGRTDSFKIKSSMTLFDSVQSQTNIFKEVLEKYFNGEKCQNTLRLLNHSEY